MSPRAGSLFALSLRELLALVALAGLGCLTLKFASDWFWIGLASAAMLLCMALLIVAVIDRGPRQAFALGFLLAGGFYFVMLLALAVSFGTYHEMDPYSGSLPTSRAMLPAFNLVVLQEYTAFAPGQPYNQKRFATQAEAEAFVATQSSAPMYATGFGGGGMSNGVGIWETPNRQDFMSIAHVWWTLLFGYLGGRFGRFIYQRRESPQPL